MDRNSFRDFIQNCQALPVERYPKGQVEQVIVAPLLQLLDWSIRDPDEVACEYSTGAGGSVDYALCQIGTPLVYVEVTNGSEDLLRHVGPLIQYALREAVDLAALTNGTDWRFYLPREGSNWEERLFWSPNLKADDVESICDGFGRYLNKEDVISRRAVQAARERLRGADIQKAMYQAWDALIEEPDPSLLDLIAQVTEAKCHHKPEVETVRTFIAENKQHFLLGEPPGGALGSDDEEAFEEVEIHGEDAGGRRHDQKAWYYWQDNSGRRYILALVNALGSCSMRRFDAKTGKNLGLSPYKKGNYQDNFSQYLQSGCQLVLSGQPNLEKTCKTRLPNWVLSELRPQIENLHPLQSGDRAGSHAVIAPHS